LATELRLLTYLSPGLPLTLFGAVANHLRRCPDLGIRKIALASEERVSGPERGSVNRSEDPFSLGEADVGFVCAPTYLRLRERKRPPAELLGVAPVFADERNRAPYFEIIPPARAKVTPGAMVFILTLGPL
jgi:hypothetical protein